MWKCQNPITDSHTCEAGQCAELLTADPWCTFMAEICTHTHAGSPYLRLWSGCSSLLWATSVAGHRPRPSETASGACSPCRSCDSPCSPAGHRYENRYQERPPTSVTSHLISCLEGAVTYHDGTVYMLLQTPVMLSRAGWCHNSSMFRL